VYLKTFKHKEQGPTDPCVYILKCLVGVPSATVHGFGALLNCVQVIFGDTTQWPFDVHIHLVMDEPNRFAAATPAIVSRQVVTPRKILERFIKKELNCY
jgi:hypothetical protein